MLTCGIDQVSLSHESVDLREELAAKVAAFKESITHCRGVDLRCKAVLDGDKGFWYHSHTGVDLSVPQLIASNIESWYHPLMGVDLSE